MVKRDFQPLSLGCHPGKRKGVSAVLAGLSLAVVVGATGFVVDMGNYYTVKAQTQRAADAAALAGAIAYGEPGVNGNNIAATALARARTFAAANGFDTANTAQNVQVTSSITPPGTTTNNLHYVTVRRDVTFYFMPIMGIRSRPVQSAATAQYISPVDINTGAASNYGKTPGNVNLSVFGPYALYSFGDAYSTKYLDNGSPNVDYRPGGYDFKLTVAGSFTGNSMAVQIFDPDTYNANGNYVGPGQIDEIRSPTDDVRRVAGSAYTTDITTTKYTLYFDDPVTGATTQIATASYGADSSTDMKWVTPSGFTFNPNSAAYGGPGVSKNFRLNVQTLDGASENGFDIRAGAPGTPDSGYATNGTTVTATGRIPINFNSTGQVSIQLAYVPAPLVTTGNPNSMYIWKFDTDVDAKSVRYFCDPPPSNQPAGGYPGVLSSNGAWLRDTITLPADYKGGQWSATYQAGANDTSVWRVEADFIAQRGGSVRLVR